MSLSDLANLSEIVGALAVVASLIFVGLEVRHNTTTARAATLQSNAAYWQEFFAMIGDPKYGKSYAKGAAGKMRCQSSQADANQIGYSILARVGFQVTQ